MLVRQVVIMPPKYGRSSYKTLGTASFVDSVEFESNVTIAQSPSSSYFSGPGYGSVVSRHASTRRQDLTSVFGVNRIPIPEVLQLSVLQGKKKLGTFFGVFIPCVQNILGVILFLRMPWICGQAGIWMSCLMILICCSVTILTALSMSAVATNGKVHAGGVYHMISRSLGPPIGGAAGILFYFGTTCGVAMYVLGAIESFVETFPNLKLYHDDWDERLFGLILNTVLAMLVFVGTSTISKVSILFLFPVLIGVSSVWIGIWTYKDGISFDTAKKNWNASYENSYGFGSVLGLLFPALSGIMAGSNRSDMLRSPSRSIPIGTLNSIAFTTFIYVSFVFLFGMCIPRKELIANKFIVPEVAWPSVELVKISIILASTGAALQSLAGAPAILAAMSQDFKDTVPIFALTAEVGEPRRSLFVTYVISDGLIMLGALDQVAPIITMFLLFCYAFVNVSCMLMDILNRPSWRPTWRYFHWLTALLGVLACAFVMFSNNLFYPLIAAGVFITVFIYISRQNVQKNWGDEFQSLKHEAAIQALVALGNASQHSKNFRPQFLLLLPMYPRNRNQELDVKLLEMCYTCAVGKGIVQVTGIIEAQTNVFESKVSFHRQLERLTTFLRAAVSRVPTDQNAFVSMYVSSSFKKAPDAILQAAGVGALIPNTLACRWPRDWKEDKEKLDIFLSSLSACDLYGKAALVFVNLGFFPRMRDRVTGFIDAWLFREDGGMLMLLTTLLRRRRCWKQCNVRLFTFAYEDEDPSMIAEYYIKLLEKIRIVAKVRVIPFGQIKRDIMRKSMGNEVDWNNNELSWSNTNSIHTSIYSNLAPSNSELGHDDLPARSSFDKEKKSLKQKRKSKIKKYSVKHKRAHSFKAKKKKKKAWKTVSK